MIRFISSRPKGKPCGSRCCGILGSFMRATREKYSIDAMGIRWEELDEDISIESFEYDDPEPRDVARL